MNLATSCNLVHVLTFYNFSFFLEPMQVVIAPAVQFPMDLCSASAIQPISFSFVVSQNSSTQKKIANLKSQIPSLAFHSEQHANAQTTLPLYFPLSGSSAKLQCCKSHETPCQPSDSTRCPLNMAQGSQRKPSGVDQHHKHLVLKLHFYQRKCHNHRRQTTLAIIATKTIELVSQPNWLADISAFIHPSREVRYDCSKPKGNACIQVVFTQSPVSLTTTPEYLPVSGFNVPSLHLYQVSQTTAPIQRT